MTSHMAQADDSLCMVGVTTFFPFLAIFFIVVAGFTVGISLVGVVSAATGVGWGSSGLRGFNPNAVMLVFCVPGMGKRYHTGNANDMLGSTSVAKTCWEVKPGGGYRKGVWEVA